jgi:hypothetical protein
MDFAQPLVSSEAWKELDAMRRRYFFSLSLASD